MTLGGAAQLVAAIARMNGLWTPRSAATQTHLCSSQLHNGLQPAIELHNMMLYFTKLRECFVIV